MVENKNFRFCFLLLMLIAVSCRKDIDIQPAPPQGEEESIDNGLISSDAFVDYADINIQTIANGNSWDTFFQKYIKDISGQNYGYCHPDVEYFPNGLDFSNFENSKIIRFINKPWLKYSANYSP